MRSVCEQNGGDGLLHEGGYVLLFLGGGRCGWGGEVGEEGRRKGGEREVIQSQNFSRDSHMYMY